MSVARCLFNNLKRQMPLPRTLANSRSFSNTLRNSTIESRGGRIFFDLDAGEVDGNGHGVDGS